MDAHKPSEEDIFEAARQLTNPDQRAAYVREACGDDEDLRLKVIALLASYERQPEFLEQPPPQVSAAAEAATETMAAMSEKPGDRIGRYKLLEHIGEGAFGEVWMAEQEQPVRRRIALKIIKLGMDTKEVVARFEAERQALAVMDHPSIAKVFDGGMTESGRPYFVMELVRGEPITKYCDEQRLSTGDRLDLFVQVCNAVQHAHQKGIIHRDLKPSNILVAELDGKAVPKVIDFGIAKATEARLTEKTLFTRLGQMVGTPAYMSPEQARQGGLDIDTRTDIYSLGIVLYELLTGLTPFDTRKLLEAGWEAIVKTIREVEPPRPSAKLSTLSPESLSTTARQRRIEPTKLSRLVRGELDWIVLKALEKDRSRRYESASEFAQDIQHYQHHEPVMAAAPSAFYKFRKFARRNPLALAVPAAVSILFLWTGISATRSQLLQNRLIEEARSAFSEAHLLLDAERELRAEARKLSVKLQLQGMLVEAEDLQRAELDVDVARKKAAQFSDAKGRAPGPAMDEAESLTALATILRRRGESAKAETMLREAIAICQELAGKGRIESSNSSRIIYNSSQACDKLGQLLNDKGDYAEAERMFRQGMTLPTRIPPALALVSLGDTVLAQGRTAEAEKIYREAHKKIRRSGRGIYDQMDGAMTLGRIADATRALGALAEAEKMYLEALDICRLNWRTNLVVAQLLTEMANVLSDEGRLQEAESAHRDALGIRRTLLGEKDLTVAYSQDSLARVLIKRTKFVEAEEIIRQCLANREREIPDDWRTYCARSVLGASLLGQSKFNESEPLLLFGYEGMKQRTEKIPATERGRLKETIQNLIQLYESTAQPDKAAKWKQKLEESTSANSESTPAPETKK